MKIIGNVCSAAKSLFYQYSGFGKRPDASPETGEAIAAVFLPLLSLVFGFAAVAAAWIVMRFGYSLAAIAAGLAALAVLGGIRQMKAVASILSEEGRTAGTAVAATLILLFEALAILEVFQSRSVSSMYIMLLYLPGAGAVAMLSAASVLKTEECSGTMFIAVKGGHMLLGCLLAFVLMLPAFGLRSLAFDASSVLAGSVTVVALRKRGVGEAPHVAAIAGQLLYLLLIMLVLPNPIIYY